MEEEEEEEEEEEKLKAGKNNMINGDVWDFYFPTLVPFPHF